MEKVICSFRGVFNGIYEWGVGYINEEKYNKWKEFWRTYGKGVFWRYFEKGESYNESQYLVSTEGSIYLHPMDFDGVLISCGCCTIVRDENGNERDVYFDSELRELNELCNACAEYCGGSFQLYVGEEIKVDMGKRKEYVVR